MDIKEKLVGFFRQCVRVWHVLKKPTRQEFTTVAKVSSVAVLIIGLLGFLVSMAIRFAIK